MGEWITSVAGIIVFGVLLDVVLPKGKTEKYIRAVFAVLVVYVVISPLPKLVKKGLNYAETFDESVVKMDFSNQINMPTFEKYLLNISEKTRNMLNNEGYFDLKVFVRCDDRGCILYVNVDFSDARESVQNEKSYLKVKKLVANYLNIDEKEVRICGGKIKKT